MWFVATDAIDVKTDFLGKCNTRLIVRRRKNATRGALKLVGTVALLALMPSPLGPTYVRAQPSSAPKSVLVLYWYNRDYPWNVNFNQSFRAALGPAETIDYYSEYLESNRFPGENQSLLLRDYLRQKYADHRIDIIVASSDASLDFLLKFRNELFPHTPMVFVASKPPPKGNITGVININAHKETLDLALRLHPGTQQVFVVSGTLQRDKKFETLAREELRDFENRLQINYITDLSLDELIAKARSFPERSIVLYIWQQLQSDQGTVLESAEILTLLAQAAQVPIYGMSTPNVGNGIVGGYINTADAVGTRVGGIVQRILAGSRAQDIPVQRAPTVPMFDWRRLRRWNISEQSLPRGSVIRFRESTLWNQYRWQIIAVLGVCLLQALLIGKLLLERRRRRKASEALARLNGDQQRIMGEITNLNRRLISAQEDERRRIAMELHDDLSQQVAALSIGVSLAKRTLANADTAREAVTSLYTGLLQLESSIHALSHELHPSLLERAGLVPALQAHCEEFKALNGIETHLTIKSGRKIPADLALCLYRITQEALRNVAKHSGAKEVWVSLSEVDNHICLSIEDAGKGFKTESSGSNGIGLVSMKERVQMVGGTFEFGNRTAGGTVTRVVVPLPAQFAPKEDVMASDHRDG